MKNIINLIKYNLNFNKSDYLTIGILIGALFLFSWVPAINIVITLIFLPIYMMNSIGKFMAHISREGGRLMFMVPIKGWEFMLASYLEFIIVSLVGVIVFNLISFKESFLLPGLYFIGIFLLIYISITSVTVIASSYFNKRWMGVTCGIIGAIILEGMYSLIYMIVKLVTPFVYVSIGGLKIDLIIVGLGIVLYSTIIMIAIKHFDDKLEIN